MTSQEVALREATQGTVAQFRDPDYIEAVAQAAGDRVSPQQLVRAAATAVLENPKLAAPNLRASLLQACLKAAMDGLLPDNREAAFVLFGGKEPKVQYMSMIGGVRKIAAEHGIDLIARVVHENDTYNPDYDARRANFARAKLGTNRGDIIGAYAEAVHRDGRRWLEAMDVADIERVRAVSRAKTGDAWTQWWDRMAEKTVARKLFKQLPLDPKDRERIERVLAADLNGDEAIAALYGRDAAGAEGVAASSASAPTADTEPIPDEADTPPLQPTTPVEADENVEDADWDDSGGVLPPDEPAAFAGDEPPAPTPQEFEATFGSGRNAGKTVREVYEAGDADYIKWASSNWKTGDIVKDIKAFIEQHPEIAK